MCQTFYENIILQIRRKNLNIKKKSNMKLLYNLFENFHFSNLLTLSGFFSFFGVIFFLLVLLILVSNLNTKKDDVKLWKRILELRSEHSDSELYYVKKIRQHASTGTKAFIVNLLSGEQTSAWFPKERIHPGNILLLEGEFGHGPHHQENVFYVRNIIVSAPKKALKHWEEDSSLYKSYCSS